MCGGRNRDEQRSTLPFPTKLYSAREQTELIVGVGTARPPLRKTNGDGPSPPRPMGQQKAQTVAAPRLLVLALVSTAAAAAWLACKVRDSNRFVAPLNMRQSELYRQTR